MCVQYTLQSKYIFKGPVRFNSKIKKSQKGLFSSVGQRVEHGADQGIDLRNEFNTRARQSTGVDSELVQLVRYHVGPLPLGVGKSKWCALANKMIVKSGFRYIESLLYPVRFPGKSIMLDRKQSWSLFDNYIFYNYIIHQRPLIAWPAVIKWQVTVQ